jgi:hypothetical protein
MGERQAGGLELPEEGRGHRDVDPDLGGGERLDAEGRGRQENERLGAVDRGLVESSRFAWRTRCPCDDLLMALFAPFLTRCAAR